MIRFSLSLRHYMKILKIILLAAFLLGNVQAEILVTLNSSSMMTKSTGDQCRHFAGLWKGNAVIEKVCKYTGSADIVRNGAAGHYAIHVTMEPNNGYFWCTKSDSLVLSGYCKGSQIAINTPDSVSISGSTDSHTAHLTGTVALSPEKIVHIDSMDLIKQA